MPSKLNILLREIKERRIMQILFFYAIGAFGFLASVYEITSVSDERIRKAALIICITGAPIVLIASYFHGKRGKNPTPVIEIILISICVLMGVGFAVKTWVAPTPMTILIRMMASQENWFIENIIKEFEKENHCKVIIKRFEKGHNLCEILRNEAETKNPNNVSLAKTPLHLTLLLHKEGLVKAYEDILSDLKLSKSEINSWVRKIEEVYDPVALKTSRFCSITGEKTYFLPRKLETRLMIYRKSKVADAIKNWRKFSPQLNGILIRENGYGLPKNYDLEPDVSKWNFYDLMVVGYCCKWA